MKVGIVSAPALLSDGLDLFDFYPVESMYDDPIFIKNMSQSKAECNHTFVFIEGVGLFPSTHLSIPLKPIQYSNFLIAGSLSVMAEKVADYIPELDKIKFSLILYGHLTNSVKGLFVAS